MGKGEYIDVSDVLISSAWASLSYPLTHAKILMQLGYEPAPTYLGNSMLSLLGIGKKANKYPSIFTYWSYMSNDIGTIGVLTTGLPARLLYMHTQSFVSDVVQTNVISGQSYVEKSYFKPGIDNTQFLMDIRDMCIVRGVSVVVSHPLQVIMVRQIAEIMRDGPRNSKYMFTIIGEIIEEDGIKGFFGGLPAKFIGEMLTILLTAGFIYGLNSYFVKDNDSPEAKQYTPTVAALFSSCMPNPFPIISNVMCLSSKVNIPNIRSYSSMLDCYWHLKDNNIMKRSTLFFRYA